MRKLDLHTSSELIKYAIQRKLIRLPSKAGVHRRTGTGHRPIHKLDFGGALSGGMVPIRLIAFVALASHCSRARRIDQLLVPAWAARAGSPLLDELDRHR
jgi:hypothetical protein